MIKQIIRRLIARDRRAQARIMPPLIGPRAEIRREIDEARRQCKCKRVGQLRAEMTKTLHEELRRGLGRRNG